MAVIGGCLIFMPNLVHRRLLQMSERKHYSPSVGLPMCMSQSIRVARYTLHVVGRQSPARGYKSGDAVPETETGLRQHRKYNISGVGRSVSRATLRFMQHARWKSIAAGGR